MDFWDEKLDNCGITDPEDEITAGRAVLEGPQYLPPSCFHPVLPNLDADVLQADSPLRPAEGLRHESVLMDNSGIITFPMGTSMMANQSGNFEHLIQSVGYRPTPSQTLLSILAAHGLHYDHVERIPAKLAREVQRRPVFENFRSIELPKPILCESLNQSILEDLLVTRIGYCSHAAGHYIPRPQGSLDYILIYCVAGKGWCEIAGKRWIVPKDTVLFIPRSTPHCYGAVADDPWSNYWIHFAGRISPDYHALFDTHAADPLFRLPISDELMSAFEATYKPMSAVHNRNHLVVGTGALARFLGMANLKRRSMGDRSRTAEEKVQETVRFMGDNLEGRYSLQELSHMAKMSRHHYCQIFRKKHGCSPLEYFTRLKIQKACQLLMSTTLQVQQIAFSLGFDDPYYFSRMFRKTIGMSPGQYRKHSQAQQPQHEYGSSHE